MKQKVLKDCIETLKGSRQKNAERKKLVLLQSSMKCLQHFKGSMKRRMSQERLLLPDR